MNNLEKTFSVKTRVIYACVFIVLILAVFYWVNGNLNIGESDLASTEPRSEASLQMPDVSLQAVSSDKLAMRIDLLATSVQDNNAVVKIGSTTKVISVGDVLDDTDLLLSGQTEVRVVQVAANQVVLKEVQKNNVYLVRMSKGGKPSVIEKITSDIQIDMPHSSG